MDLEGEGEGEGERDHHLRLRRPTRTRMRTTEYIMDLDLQYPGTIQKCIHGYRRVAPLTVSEMEKKKSRVKESEKIYVVEEGNDNNETG